MEASSAGTLLPCRGRILSTSGKGHREERTGLGGRCSRNLGGGLGGQRGALSLASSWLAQTQLWVWRVVEASGSLWTPDIQRS